MEKYKIVRIQDNKEFIVQAANWFHQKWGIPQKAYMESMEECIKNISPIPQWYAAWSLIYSLMTRQLRKHGGYDFSRGVYLW